MFRERKMKPDRSIIGWLVPLLMLVIFGAGILIFGYRTGMYILAGLVGLYAVYTLLVFLRTRNIEHLVVLAFQVFLMFLCANLPNYIGNQRQESKEAKIAAIIGMIFFLVMQTYLVLSRRIKWRGTEVFELAAETVAETGNGYTPRPRPVGKVEFSKEEILALARFCARHLIAISYVSPRQVTIVPVRMGQEYHAIFRLAGAQQDSSWISFDFDGDVSVHIAQKDYLNYREPLAFDPLCQSLGQLFIEFGELQRRGEGVRIIDRMNDLQIGILA